MENEIIIDPNRHILVDTNVLTGAFNKLDNLHKKSITFFNKLDKNKQVILPAHSLFEFISSIHRRLKNDQPYLSFDKDELRIPFDTIYITQQLANECRDKKLFELFNTLRGGDLIYACIAKLYSLEFVTFDLDFKPYEKEIKITFL